MTLPNRIHAGLEGIGTLNQPTSGRVDLTGIEVKGNITRLDFRFRRARIVVTDATTSGSYGAFKFFDFANEQAIAFLGSRQDYTSYVSDGTGVPNDTAFEIGVGTTAISAAADGTLGNGVNENVGQAVAQTLSTGTTTGTAVTNGSVVNGTATALDLALNFSGSAATVDDDGWIDVNGTFSVSFTYLGDD
jgi:uncharacterized membrane protein